MKSRFYKMERYLFRGLVTTCDLRGRGKLGPSTGQIKMADDQANAARIFSLAASRLASSSAESSPSFWSRAPEATPEPMMNYGRCSLTTLLLAQDAGKTLAPLEQNLHLPLALTTWSLWSSMTLLEMYGGVPGHQPVPSRWICQGVLRIR